MPDPLGIAPPQAGRAQPLLTAVANAAVANASLAELLSAPPPIAATTNLMAMVIDRSPEGAVLLRTALGMMTLKTSQPLPQGAQVALKLVPGNPPTVSIVSVEAPEAPEAPPPMQMALGSTVTATVVASAPQTPSGGATAPAAAATFTPMPSTVTSSAAPQATPIPSTQTPPAPASSGVTGNSAPSSAAQPTAPQQDAPPIGARVELRVAAAPAATTSDVSAPAATPGKAVAAAPMILTGTVQSGPAGETLVETAIGVLALDRRLALPPGTMLNLERLGVSAPETADMPPTQSSGWPTLDQTLSTLEKIAPNLAQQMRAELSPANGQSLAGTLLFLMGALDNARWPGAQVARALLSAGHDKLQAKLDGDLADLRRLSADGATGEWRVLTLPLLNRQTVDPVRVYVRQRGAGDKSQDGARFVIETELSRLGTVQLDGLVRDKRLDLVVRSHTALAPELRAEATQLFRQTSAAHGYSGDIVFATAAQFAVAPLANLRTHVEVRV